MKWKQTGKRTDCKSVPLSDSLKHLNNKRPKRSGIGPTLQEYEREYMIEEKFMRRAVELAKGGIGAVDPNPLVGAVIVKDEKIIGEGYHKRYGGLHAERNALASVAGTDLCEAPAHFQNLRDILSGADMYVTLEPCAHYGKTPPCTEAIIESGISRVIIGSRDPNPLVAGKGVEQLEGAGIEVVQDFCRDECDALNIKFFHFITTGTPYVLMKYAMTADGKIATKTGASKWISCEKSREYVHGLRNEYPAILAGIGTVLADDPMLTARIPGARDPLRVIADSRLRIPVESNIIKTAKDKPTMIISAMPEDEFNASEKKAVIEQTGAEPVNLPAADGHVDLKKMVRLLGERKISGLLIEGGGDLNYAALNAGIVNELNVFVAPKIFGGMAKTPVGGEGVELPGEAVGLELIASRMMGEDMLLKYKVRYPGQLQRDGKDYDD